MFAMLGGALPGDLEAAVDAQLDTGIAVVTDGRETVPTGMRAASALGDDLLAGRGSGAAASWARTVGRVDAASADSVVRVAATLPGPWSLAACDADLPTVDMHARAIELGGILGAEAATLAASGCPLVRVDEPIALDLEVGSASGAAFTAAHAALCVAAGAGHDEGAHLMLALTGGSHERVGAGTLADLAYASFLFDLVRGPDDWRLVAALPGDRGIICGVVDAAMAIGDEPEILVWAAHYAASTGGRGLARVGLSTTGSLAGLDADVVMRKLRALADGARIAALPRDEMAGLLDPRALDLRSAATGVAGTDQRFDPRRR